MDLYWMWKWFFYVVLRLFFSEVEVIGAENIPTTGAVIFVGTIFLHFSRCSVKKKNSL
jgi:1-acyl-sn-glycerol-3-phosphate acyltransferase